MLILFMTITTQGGSFSNKYLGIDIHYKLNWNYIMEKRINGGWKPYFGHEINCKLANLMMWDKKKFLFETLIILVILYGCEVWDCNISRESWEKLLTNLEVFYNL